MVQDTAIVTMENV